MSELIQSVKDGVIQQTKKEETTSSTKNELGKDAFLQLLVTQMKYQDPLNPNTDTEYIAQLATFSQLEQLKNLGDAATKSQAFGLVGKNVIVKTENSSGDSAYVSGKVDFVNLTGSKTQLSINGKLYSIDQLDTVLDDDYLAESASKTPTDNTGKTEETEKESNESANETQEETKEETQKETQKETQEVTKTDGK